MQSSQLYRASQVGAPALLKMARQSNSIDRIEFNLSKGNYRDLIQQIRNIVKQPGRYSHNRPVLPNRYSVPPQDWLDVVLSTDTTTITFRLRQDNLYLEGYQLPCGQWLEFDKDDGTTFHLIPNSAFLGFSGGYPALASAGGRYVHGTQVSRERVIAAVNELAQTNNRISRARDLTLLIIVICEATRFEEMTGRFASVMRSGSTETETIEGWMMRLFRAWGDLSGRLIRADADGDDYFRIPNDSPLRENIQSALDATRYVGLLLGPLLHDPSNCRGIATKRSSNNNNGFVPRGQPMMEVLSIKISDFSGDLSGTIIVTDGLGQQTLFNGKQRVESGDTLTLTLLDRSLSAWESLVTDYDLSGYQVRDSWDIFQPKDDYSDDSYLSCNQRCVRLTENGTSRLSGRRNSITITTDYGLFREAWQVKWEVKINTGDGYDPMNVYGRVQISYTDGGEGYDTKLFSRTSSNNVVVYVGGCVPLTRKATAVPIDIDVDVDVDLWDYIHVFPDRCISRGHGLIRFGSTNTYGGSNLGGAQSQVLKLGGNSNDSYAVVITARYSPMSADA